MNTTPEYTDEEIRQAAAATSPFFSESLDWLRAFLAALPSRQQAVKGGQPVVDNEPAKEEQQPDPYAELKAAYKAGKTIQFNVGKWANPEAQDAWEDRSNPVFDLDATLYRVKPEPDTFHAHGHTWTRHTPGDPMPCDGRLAVKVAFKDGSYSDDEELADNWQWGTIFDESEWIIGWRYADEPAKPEPAKPEPATPEPTQAQPWTPAVGNTVQIKSGGPKMTVTRVDGSTITCVWFNQSQNERTACFAVELLQQA